MLVSMSADDRDALQTCWCLCSLLTQHKACFHKGWISLRASLSSSPGGGRAAADQNVCVDVPA